MNSIDKPRNVRLLPDECALLLECIRITEPQITLTLEGIHKVFPESALAESCRRWLESLEDIKSKLRVREENR